jgi:hypothetical protein
MQDRAKIPELKVSLRMLAVTVYSKYLGTSREAVLGSLPVVGLGIGSLDPGGIFLGHLVSGHVGSFSSEKNMPMFQRMKEIGICFGVASTCSTGTGFPRQGFNDLFYCT